MAYEQTEVTHLFSEETGRAGASALERLAALKAAEIGMQVRQLSDWQAFEAMVASGDAQLVAPVNARVALDWADPTSGTTKTYSDRFRVLGYREQAVKGQGARPLCYLQQALTLPFDTQFDNFEAFYAAPAGGLAAGTYRVSSAITFGRLVKGQTYEFTLAKDLPEGGQLAFSRQCYDYEPSQVCSYASRGAAEAQETVPVTAGGTGGTLLGEIGTGALGDSDVNNAYRVCMGSNRWATSGLRQWLNSEAAAGAWWEPQTKFDRPPDYASTKAGYLSGFADREFVAALKPVEVRTALPYCDGGTESGTECDVTYDRVWLPSAEELYWAATGYGVPYGLEGAAFEYYRQLHAESTPASVWDVHKEYVMYSMGAETSAQYVWERSAYRDSGCSVALCNSAGYVDYNYACRGRRCAPLVAI